MAGAIPYSCRFTRRCSTPKNIQNIRFHYSVNYNAETMGFAGLRWPHFPKSRTDRLPRDAFDPMELTCNISLTHLADLSRLSLNVWDAHTGLTGADEASGCWRSDEGCAHGGAVSGGCQLPGEDP